MGMVRLIYRNDGGVSVIHPAPKTRKENENENDWFNRTVAKATPIDADYKDVDISQLKSRRFRNCWVKSNDGVSVDLIKAKEIILKELREVRNSEIIKTDSEVAKLNDIGTPQEKDNLKKRRQDLRDLPAVVKLKLDAIDNIEELESKYPKRLKVEDYININ